MESPSPFDSPKIFGSWLMVTKIARPKMNPAIAGLDRNDVTKPSLSVPATTRSRPVSTIIPDASARKAAGSLGSSAATVEYTSTADALVPATTSWRLVPKTAYSPSDATSV